MYIVDFEEDMKTLTILASIVLILCLETVAWATDTTAEHTSQDGIIVLSGLGTNWIWNGDPIQLTGYGAEFAKTPGKHAQLRLGSTSGPTLPMLYTIDGASQILYVPTAVRWIPAYNASDNDLAPGSKIYIFYRPR